jgi:predicted P-loop ATPase
LVEIDKEFYQIFRELLTSLGDYTKDIVIIGGFANALYQYHEWGSDSKLGNLLTKDIDLLTSDKVTKLEETIVDRLTNSGFEIKNVPVKDKFITKFIKNENFEIEFLCPSYGRGEKITTTIQKDLVAQPLKYLDLALYNTVEISTENIPELKGLHKAIQLPSPAAYLIQKFIILDKRERFLQKDCFYIYELLVKFSKHLDKLINEIQSIENYNLSEKINYKKVKRFRENFKKYFGDEDGQGYNNIMKELQDRGNNGISKDQVYGTFELFLDKL